MKHLLYGFDNEEGIVNIQPVPKSSIVQVFSRKDGVLEDRYELFDLLVYTNDKNPALRDVRPKDITVLGGTNHHNRLVVTNDWDTYMYLKKSEDVYVPKYRMLYQLQSGKTPYKGITTEDVVVLFFDIEVYTTPGYDFPIATRDTDKVIMISTRTNKGVEKVFHGDNETAVISEFFEYLRQVDPDILCNHSIFNFDLPYLVSRCNFLGIPMQIGRDGSEPRSYESRVKFADRESSFDNFQIYGRDIIDTYFLAQQADIGKREMPSYRLKEIVKWLGLASDEREYIEGQFISWYWDNDRQALLRYALDDVREAEILFNRFGGATFIGSRFFPHNLQDTAILGTGGKCETLFLREYLRKAWSLPKPSPKRDFIGGFAGCMAYGFIDKPLVGVDVESLYPTLAEDLGIKPKHDELEIFPAMVRLLKSERLVCKKNAKSAPTPQERSMWAATDVSVKILLNTLSFGWLSSEWNPWNDYDEAERITTNGRRVIKSMIYNATQMESQPVKIDTDGMICTIPDGVAVEDFVTALQQAVNDWVGFGLYDGDMDEMIKDIT